MLHGQLWKSSLGGSELVAITTAAAAANLCFRRRKRRYISIRKKRHHRSGRFDSGRGLAREHGATDQQRDQHNVHSGRGERAIFFVIVEAPNIAHRNRL